MIILPHNKTTKIRHLVKQLKMLEYEDDATVHCDFLGLRVIKNITCYRGDYKDAALQVELNTDYRRPHRPKSVHPLDLAEYLENEAQQVPHFGHKGGEYCFDDSTKLWIAEDSSDWSKTAIIGLIPKYGLILSDKVQKITLITRYRPFND